jgi:hypothetical protein
MISVGLIILALLLAMCSESSKKPAYLYLGIVSLVTGIFVNIFWRNL